MERIEKTQVQRRTTTQMSLDKKKRRGESDTSIYHTTGINTKFDKNRKVFDKHVAKDSSFRKDNYISSLKPQINKLMTDNVSPQAQKQRFQRLKQDSLFEFSGNVNRSQIKSTLVDTSAILDGGQSGDKLLEMSRMSSNEGFKNIKSNASRHAMITAAHSVSMAPQSVKGHQSGSRMAAHTLGDYNSQQVLPVIGTESSVERRRNFSKVELSRKDMQNFLVNGTVTKEFIKSNKKELEKFIKSQTRSGSEQNFFKGYNEVTGLKRKSPFIQAGSPSNQLSELTREAGAGGFDTPDVDALMANRVDLMQAKRSVKIDTSVSDVKFPNDQKTEQKFKGETSVVTNRVLETWINESLMDAEHLDIPGVIVKPEHKNPISRYQVDRNTLTVAGLSSNDVDRIYRSLFVYSVGFFELLKKVLSSTSKNYQVVISIWKVFHVLLEYCCKSDYKIMIAEITQMHEEEKEKLSQKHKEKLQQYIDNERVFRQNIDTMQQYQDELEKEKANERKLRLQLEQEYMQNMKNHEDEVQLRIKFEDKLKKMAYAHRELEIKYERSQHELNYFKSQLKRFEETCSEQRTELQELRARRLEHESLIDKLKEKTETQTRDLDKKNAILSEVESQILKANEAGDLIKYQVQDNIKQQTVMEIKIETLEELTKKQQNDAEQLEILKLRAEETAATNVKKYQESKMRYENLISDLDATKERLADRETVVKQLEEQIDEIRSQQKKIQQRNEELEIDSSATKIENERLTGLYEQAKKSFDDVTNQLHKMNEARHEVENKLKEEKDVTALQEREIKKLEDSVFDLQEKNKDQHQQINKLEYEKDAALTAKKQLQEELDQKIISFTKRIREVENSVGSERANMMKWRQKHGDIEVEAAKLNSKLEKAINASKLAEQEKSTAVAAATREREISKREQEQARKDKQEAKAAMLRAEQVMRQMATLEATIQYMTKQRTDTAKRHEEQMATIYKKWRNSEERNTMVIEDMSVRMISQTEDIKKKNGWAEWARAEIAMTKRFREDHEALLKRLDERKKENSDLEKTINKLEDQLFEIGSKHRQEINDQEKQHNITINVFEQQVAALEVQLQKDKIAYMDEAQKMRTELSELKATLRQSDSKSHSGIQSVSALSRAGIRSKALISLEGSVKESDPHRPNTIQSQMSVKFVDVGTQYEMPGKANRSSMASNLSVKSRPKFEQVAQSISSRISSRQGSRQVMTTNQSIEAVQIDTFNKEKRSSQVEGGSHVYADFDDKNPHSPSQPKKKKKKVKKGEGSRRQTVMAQALHTGEYVQQNNASFYQQNSDIKHQSELLKSVTGGMEYSSGGVNVEIGELGASSNNQFNNQQARQSVGPESSIVEETSPRGKKSPFTANQPSKTAYSHVNRMNSRSPKQSDYSHASSGMKDQLGVSSFSSRKSGAVRQQSNKISASIRRVSIARPDARLAGLEQYLAQTNTENSEEPDLEKMKADAISKARLQAPTTGGIDRYTAGMEFKTHSSLEKEEEKDSPEDSASYYDEESGSEHAEDVPKPENVYKLVTDQSEVKPTDESPQLRQMNSSEYSGVKIEQQSPKLKSPFKSGQMSLRSKNSSPNRTNTIMSPQELAEREESKQRESYQKLSAFLIEQEREFLQKLSDLIKSGDKVDTSLIMKMRKQNKAIIQQQFKGVTLTKEQKLEIQKKQEQQAKEFQKNAQSELKDLLQQEQQESDELVQRQSSQFKNIFSNFAKNYANELDVMMSHAVSVKQSHAKERRQPHKNDEVENIMGRDELSWLIEMPREPSFDEIHRGKLMEGLQEAVTTFNEKKSRRTQEQSRQASREHSEENESSAPPKVEIIREDLQQSLTIDVLDRRPTVDMDTDLHLKHLADKQRLSRERSFEGTRVMGSLEISQQASRASRESLNNVVQTKGPSRASKETLKIAQHESPRLVEKKDQELIKLDQPQPDLDNTRRHSVRRPSVNIDNYQDTKMDQLPSAQQLEDSRRFGGSKDSGLSAFADSQNNKDSDLMDIHNQMSQIYEAQGNMSSKPSMRNNAAEVTFPTFDGTSGRMDSNPSIKQLSPSRIAVHPEIDFSEINKGGVAAINKKAAQERKEHERLQKEKHEAAIKKFHESEHKRKTSIMQTPAKPPTVGQTTQNRPKNLGPSTIRTMIRAASSRD